jgi:hypothetical protein
MDKHFSLLRKFENYGDKKFYNMGPRSIYDTTRVVRITTVGDTTAWSIVSDDSTSVIYAHNIFIIQATVCKGQMVKLILLES